MLRLVVGLRLVTAHAWTHPSSIKGEPIKPSIAVSRRLSRLREPSSRLCRYSRLLSYRYENGGQRNLRLRRLEVPTSFNYRDVLLFLFTSQVSAPCLRHSLPGIALRAKTPLPRNAAAILLMACVYRPKKQSGLGHTTPPIGLA